MNVRVGQVGEWWVVASESGPVTTPAGTPLVSHHREIAEEAGADVARWGTDPTAKTTTFSLQASYLDFGIPVKRHVLEENAAAIWPDDLFVQRDRTPELVEPLRALWGPVELDRASFRDALRRLTLRQLMATMTAGHVFRSALLGLRVVTTDAPLPPLAMGACGRRFPSKDRHVPTDRDEDYCAGVCCAGTADDLEAFRRRCALLPLLDKMRRWARFPEEVEKAR